MSDETSFAPALLPTALVDILAPDGTKHCVRALIDQGAQCSMINTEVAKSLKLITKPAYVAVTGVGGVTSAYAHGRVTFDIVSRCNPEVQIAVDALILSRVTNYVSSHRRFGEEWTHLEVLLFADDYTDECRKIDIILGSDVHAKILLGDIRKSADHNAMAPIAQNTTLGWIISGPTGNHLFNNVATISTNQACISRPDHHVKHLIKDSNYLSYDANCFPCLCNLNNVKPSLLMSLEDIKVGRMFTIHMLSKMERNSTYEAFPKFLIFTFKKYKTCDISKSVFLIFFLPSRSKAEHFLRR